MQCVISFHDHCMAQMCVLQGRGPIYFNEQTGGEKARSFSPPPTATPKKEDCEHSPASSAMFSCLLFKRKSDLSMTPRVIALRALLRSYQRIRTTTQSGFHPESKFTGCGGLGCRQLGRAERTRLSRCSIVQSDWRPKYVPIYLLATLATEASTVH